MDLSKELSKIWDQLEKTGIMRASLFNLIVVSPKNERSTYLRTITQKVIERFPCRVIFITLFDGPHEFTTRASATTGIGGKPDIACDMIEIEASQSDSSKIPFVILPHFLPDLPIYLLWALQPVSPLLTELQKWATRFIFDSEVTDNLTNFSKQLLSQPGEEVADLNWARTENWRELLAATFYSPARLSSLQKAKTIHLHYNTFETPFFCHTKIQAIYLQSWLATRLSWKLISTTPEIWTYDRCQVFFHPEKNSALAPGTVLSLEIFCEDQAHFSFRRDPEHPYQVLTIACDEEKCDIPSRFIFAKAQSGLSLVNQIYHSDPSSHFPAILKFLSKQDVRCLS